MVHINSGDENNKLNGLWKPNEKTVEGQKDRFSKNPPLKDNIWTVQRYKTGFETGATHSYHYGKDPEGKYIIEIVDYYTDDVVDKVIKKEFDDNGNIVKESQDYNVDEKPDCIVTYEYKGNQVTENWDDDADGKTDRSCTNEIYDFKNK